jgi:hypothetical protein
MIIITGASDDLIEIDGDINEEFSSYDCENGLLCVSDGTLISVKYDEDGIWRLTPKYRGSAYKGHELGDVEADTNDKVFLEGTITWIVFTDEPQSSLVK